MAWASYVKSHHSILQLMHNHLQNNNKKKKKAMPMAFGSLFEYTRQEKKLPWPRGFAAAVLFPVS